MKATRVLLILTMALTTFLLAGCAIQPIAAPEAAAPDQMAMDETLTAEGISMPDVFLATSPSYLAGTWSCGEGDGAKLIRFDPDGTYHKVLGPNDSIPIGYFWFTDGEFHVTSAVDSANMEGAFQVMAVVEGGETYLTFKPCGGNCETVNDIDWEAGMRLLLPPG